MTRARPIIETWEPSSVRNEALVLLDVYSNDGFEEQDEIFANRYETSAPREVSDWFWKLVETIDLD